MLCRFIWICLYEEIVVTAVHGTAIGGAGAARKMVRAAMKRKWRRVHGADVIPFRRIRDQVDTVYGGARNDDECW